MGSYPNFLFKAASTGLVSPAIIEILQDCSTSKFLSLSLSLFRSSLIRFVVSFPGFIWRSMTAFYNHNHNLQLPLPLVSTEEMTNDSFPFFYYQGSAETIPESSSTDHPRSRSSSISNANAAYYMERRKSTYESWLSPVKSKDKKNRRNRNQKKKVEEKKKEGEAEEPPAGYIHVRARRGQATDSHSLAERVRREKISERMKVLQGLVPGCEKVVGKALMLDEIINYVQSLQNQVEFLSMKLACLNPMLFDFSVDYDCLVNQTEFEVVGSMPQASHPMPSSLLQASLIQPPSLDQCTAKAYEAMMNPPILLQCQGPIPLSHENSSHLMQVGDQREQELLNHIMLNNMCSFQ